jgi:hypothetical protein
MDKKPKIKPTPRSNQRIAVYVLLKPTLNGIHLAVLLCITMLSELQAQPDLEQLKKFYRDEQNEPCNTIKETEKLQIVLIRHGEPDLVKKGWKDRNAAIAYIRAYDTVDIIPFQQPPLCPSDSTEWLIYHSTLRRAAHTAELLFPKREIVPDERFIELQRKILGFPNIRMPHGFWVGMSRTLWLMGLNDRDIESRKAGKQRIKNNASFLDQAAKESSVIVVVAHGLHNRYLRKYLKKLDWKVVHNGGNNYLAVVILAHE